MGVGYTWDGIKIWVGVTTQKNSLGVICTLSAFFIIWALYNKWRTRELFKNTMHVCADCLVLAIALYLLQGFQGANSATAVGIMIVGISTLFTLSQSKTYAGHLGTVLIIGLSVVLVSLQASNSVREVVTSVFNRDPSFTGRVDIWNLVLEEASKNHWFGGGYGGYWGLADEKIVMTQGVSEAHSGYLEVYLAGGITGVVLFTFFLMEHHRKVLRELRHAYEWGLFGVCILTMMLVENFTESVFIRTSSYLWNIMVVLAIVFSESLGRQSQEQSVTIIPNLPDLGPGKSPAPTDESRIYRTAK
jgi:O-antigen ligase